MPELSRIPPGVLGKVPEARVRRYAKIIHGLWRKKARCFFMIMGVGDFYDYKLAIPEYFLKRHAHRFTQNVTFEIQNCAKRWPMKISVKYVENSRKIRCGYVKKWLAFAKDNDIEAGDLVIFRLVEYSRFVVYVYKAHASEPHNVEDVHDVVNQVERNSDCTNSNDNDALDELVVTPPLEQLSITRKEPSIAAPIEIQCTTCAQARVQWPCPLFVTTARHSTADPREEINMDVPAKFWELHGQLLPGDELHMQGPNNCVMKVKIRRSLNALRPNVRLEEGWEAFFVANNLQMGDSLLFSLIALSFFRVEVLDRYD